jgi:hypothetical protein
MKTARLCSREGILADIRHSPGLIAQRARIDEKCVKIAVISPQRRIMGKCTAKFQVTGI